MRSLVCLLIASMIACAPEPRAADTRELTLKQVSLDLPGPPAALVPADLNGDGRMDLVVAVVYTAYDELSFERAEGFVQMTEIVPALFDRRELRVYLADAQGGYRLAADPLPLPATVHTIEAGPVGIPVIALTDEGVSALSLGGLAGGSGLTLKPLVADQSVLAGSGSFLPGLEMVKDLDGDGKPDLLLPASGGPAVYLAGASGLSKASAGPLALPGDTRGLGRNVWRRYPIPQVTDVDGDGRPDLVMIKGKGGDATISILRGEGGGRFLPPRESSVHCLERSPQDQADAELAWFGDLDGDGRAEVVTVMESEQDDGGLKEAKQPHQVLSFHRLRPDLGLEPKPYLRLEAVGYPFGGQWPDIGRAELKDLDGDGRKDLVMVTLDFSLFQILHVLATKRFSMGLQFHIWAQGPDGRFNEVTGLDLSEKLTLDFNNLKLGRFAQFNGDFDGDGRADFVHLGRGRSVTIHRGLPGCHYNDKPDLSIELEEEPQDIGLVQIRDLDGDGRSDLSITRPLPSPEPGASTPVILELYLSGGGSRNPAR